MNKCQCGAELKEDSVFCPECGEKVVKAKQTVYDREPSEDRCENCESRRQQHFQFCDQCGNNLWVVPTVAKSSSIPDNVRAVLEDAGIKGHAEQMKFLGGIQVQNKDDVKIHGSGNKLAGLSKGLGKE